jgi:PAS domain S-box-containing protein
VNEVQVLAEAVLEAATTAGFGVTVSFDDGTAPRFIYVNQAAASAIGYEVDELLGKEVFDSFGLAGSERLSEFFATWRETKAGPSSLETVLVRKDGQRVPVEIAVSAAYLGGTPAIVTFIRNIQERKDLQAQLAFSDRMATLGTLAAGVAHEINNPLGYISLSIDSIVRQLMRYAPGEVCSRIEPELTAAREGLGRVARIVRDLQSLSVPKSVELWPVNVREVVESTLNIAMHEIRGRAQVALNFGQVAMLKTDPTRLGQIVLNLVINAAQSFATGDETKNVITIGIEQLPAEGIVISIADNGPGIAPGHLGRIFEPFFTTRPNGTGLGLAICQSLARALDAKLDVQSEPGKGTRFRLAFPSRGEGL